MEKKEKNRLSPFSVILIMVALSIIGIASLPLLKISYTPSPKSHTLTVYYSYPGATARTAENEVTSKIEGILASLDGCEGTSSVSYPGGGSASVNISKKKDIAQSRLELSSSLRSLWDKLPNTISYPEISLNTRGKSNSIAISYTIKSTLPSKEIEDYTSKNILPFLSAIKGVESISLNGSTPFIYEIRYNAPLCHTLGISANDIISKLRESQNTSFIGFTDIDEHLLSVSLSLKTESLESIPIKTVGDRIICLSDIAECCYKEGESKTYYRINGLNTINLSIRLTNDSNLITTTDRIKKEMLSLSKNFPDEITVNLSYDSSEYIVSELNKIYLRVGLCVLILLAFVYLTYKSIRYLLIIVFTLLVNILTALAFYAFAGINIHIYTLAGITVALGIVIDSSIVMIDHYRRHHDRKAFYSLLAAISTDIVALLLIFLLPESEITNLTDFIWVIILNLAVSLCIAMLFIPALMEYIPISANKISTKNISTHGVYSKYIQWSANHKWIFLLLIIVFTGISFYPFYKNLDKQNFYRIPEQKVLHIAAGMPDECTILQLNEVVKSMENYLSKFDQIKSYITYIGSNTSATIDVFFYPEWYNTTFPAELQSMVTSMAMDFGGANWSIYGITDNSFNNNIQTFNKSQRITLSGYNYDALIDHASKLIDYLSRNKRVSEPEIWSADWNGAPKTELAWKYNFENMALYGISPKEFHSELTESLFKMPIGYFPINDEMTEAILVSSEHDNSDLWMLSQKLSSLGKIIKDKGNINIYKYNQSYVINVCYDYIGSYELAKKTADAAIKYMKNNVLPLGFDAKTPEFHRFDNNKENYGWLIVVIIIALFVLLCIAFESLKQPLAVILSIPISFIGVFLSFAFSPLTFDQGGFAALVMLCGITVNAGIYLICTYNSLKDTISDPLIRYISAFNYKIRPIMLTIISTILGLIPFLTEGPEEVFWFDFAIGTISGMILSIVAVFFILPAFIVPRKKA